MAQNTLGAVSRHFDANGVSTSWVHAPVTGRLGEFTSIRHVGVPEELPRFVTSTSAPTG